MNGPRVHWGRGFHLVLQLFIVFTHGKIIESENLDKELSNVTETISRKEAEMKQTKAGYESARTDLEAKVTEKELQVQNLQVNMSSEHCPNLHY